MISVIIVFKKESNYLEKCLKSLERQLNKNFEVILVSENKISGKINYDFPIKEFKTEEISPGIKRHIGVFHSRGEDLAFIDDDAYPNENWTTIIEENLKLKNVITGPAISPDDENYSARKNLYSSIYFSKFFGGSSHRYLKNSEILMVDDFASVNFAIKKKVYEKSCGFNVEYWPGEDTYLANDLIFNQDEKIYHIPELLVKHERRDSFINFVKQIFRYSYTRGYFFKKKIKNSIKFKYTLPSLLLSFFIIGIIFKSILILKLFFIYAAIIFLGSFEIYAKMKKKYMIFSFLFIIISHLIYGFGFLKGVISSDYKKI